MAHENRMLKYDEIYSYAFEGVHGGGLEHEDFDAIINAIDTVPSIDAVEVIRCKVCKHYRHFVGCGNWCHRRLRSNIEFRVKPNDFCSYGERKNNVSSST